MGAGAKSVFDFLKPQRVGPCLPAVLIRFLKCKFSTMFQRDVFLDPTYDRDGFLFF
jgi:hypothetical protein